MNTKSLILGVISTILVVVPAFFSFRFYAPSIYSHLQLPKNTWAILTFLLCMPGVIASIGMIIRKMWSLPLAAFLSLSLSAISVRYLIVNIRINALYHKDMAFIFTVIIVYFVLFLLLAFNSGVKQYFNFPSGLKAAKEYFYNYRFPFIICLVVLVVAQTLLVKQYLYYQQYPWPPPEMANQEMHKKWPFFVKGNIQNKDIEIIVPLINGVENIDKNILYVIQEEDGTVTVYTGELIAPLWGGGDQIKLKKENNVWEIIVQGTWLTKNELPNNCIQQMARSAAALTRQVPWRHC